MSHPLKKYRDICLWAGLPTSTMTPIDVFTASGQIIAHLSRQRQETGKTTQQLLEEMKPEELRHVRETIHWQETLEAPKYCL